MTHSSGCLDDDRELGPRNGSRDDRGAGGGRSYNDRPPMNRDYDHYDGGRYVFQVSRRFLFMCKTPSLTFKLAALQLPL